MRLPRTHGAGILRRWDGKTVSISNVRGTGTGTLMWE